MCSWLALRYFQPRQVFICWMVHAGFLIAIEFDFHIGVDHANNLSKDQEDLLRQAREIDPRSGVMRDMAADQQVTPA